MKDIEDSLRRSYLFSGFEPEDLYRFAEISKRRELSGGEPVFDEGQPGDSLFLVDKGRIRIYRVFSETYEETIALLDPGSIFGDMSFIDRVPRSAAAMAMETSVIIEMSRTDFDVIFEKSPTIAMKVFKRIGEVIAGRIKATDEKIKEVMAWVADIQRWSQWSIHQLPHWSRRIEIFLRGQGQFSGRVIDVPQSALGNPILWEDEEKRLYWTPYHALYYLRVKA